MQLFCQTLLYLFPVMNKNASAFTPHNDLKLCVTLFFKKSFFLQLPLYRVAMCKSFLTIINIKTLINYFFNKLCTLHYLHKPTTKAVYCTRP